MGLLAASPATFAQAAGADAPRNRVSQPATLPATLKNPSKLTTGAVEFEPKPLSVETVGLTMRIPLGSTAQTTSIATRAAVQISPRDTSWIVNIQTPQTLNPKVTTAETANSIALQVMKAAGEVTTVTAPGSKAQAETLAVTGKVLEDCHDVTVNGQTASRLYISVPGPDNVNTVRGYTVFKPSATQFVTFELICSEALFPKARLAYEAMLATAEYRDPGAIDAERAAAVNAGLKILEGLDEKALRDIVAAQPEHWERLYYPASSGSPKDALEAGYRRFRLSIGSRESINGDAKGGDMGVIVNLDARFLQDVRPDINKQESKRIVDSQSVFFMSFDRKEEVWNVRMAVREGKDMAMSSEVGARNGRSMNVQVDVTGQPTKTIKPLFQGDAYISRVESVLMPQILIRAGVQSGFSYYAYKSESGNVLLRHDTLEQPADRPGLYKVTTRFADEIDKTTMSLYNEKGVMIRSELPGGLVYEPINFEQLLALWKSKHLTTD
jgi:hypothetical protein